MTIAEIMKKMIVYSEGNFHDIDHLIRVWTYAKTIGELEGLDGETQYILEVAAITHDIAPSLAYRSPYVGDNSNTVALFQSLPLGQRKQTYEIDSDACTVTIRYEDNVESETRLAVMQADMVYTAVAAMAAIDNLNGVTYQFPDAAYTLTRKQVAGVFGQNLASLLEETTWENTVAGPLRKDGFAQQFFEK